MVRFRHQADRDRVLAAGRTRAPLPLVWRPWRRTSTATADTFRFKVLVALRHVLLHARTAKVAQTILGPCCSNILLVQLRDVPVDADREMFVTAVTAWCRHPHLISEEENIFIPEPPIPGNIEAERSQLPGLHYSVRIHVVAFQNWNGPLDHPGGDGGDEGGNGGDDELDPPPLRPYFGLQPDPSP